MNEMVHRLKFPFPIFDFQFSDSKRNLKTENNILEIMHKL